MNLYTVTIEVRTFLDVDRTIKYVIATSSLLIAEKYPTAKYISLLEDNVEMLGTEKQPQTHKEYLEELRVHDPITYSELTSDPTGSSGDEITYLVIAFGLGVIMGNLILAL